MSRGTPILIDMKEEDIEMSIPCTPPAAQVVDYLYDSEAPDTVSEDQTIPLSASVSAQEWAEKVEQSLASSNTAMQHGITPPKLQSKLERQHAFRLFRSISPASNSEAENLELEYNEMQNEYWPDLENAVRMLETQQVSPQEEANSSSRSSSSTMCSIPPSKRPIPMPAPESYATSKKARTAVKPRAANKENIILKPKAVPAKRRASAKPKPAPLMRVILEVRNHVCLMLL